MAKESNIRLLNHLRDNSRESLSVISKKTNIPISTLAHKLRDMEENIIKKHVSLIDFAKLGYNVTVHYIISSEDKNKTKDFLINNPNVNNLHTLLDKHDFSAECIFRDFGEMTRFKDEMEQSGATHIQEIFILGELKKEDFKINLNI